MKFTKFTLSLFLLCAFRFSHAQDNAIKAGFFINNGNTKVETLDCYGFDNLMVAFEVIPQMFEFDKVNFFIKVDATEYYCTMTKAEFKLKFEGKKSGYLWVFDGAEKEGGKFLAFYDPYPPVARKAFAKAGLGSLKNNAKVRLYVRGATKEGVKYNADTQRTEPTYSWVFLYDNENELTLNNRTGGPKKGEPALGPCYPSDKKELVVPTF